MEDQYGTCCRHCLRSRGCEVTAAVYSVMMSVLCGAGFLYLAICLWMDIDYIGQGMVTTATLAEDLYLPVNSTESFQRVFTLGGAVSYLTWLPTAILLVVGICRGKTTLYLPWLVWTGLLTGLAVFGIVHLITSQSVILQYVLAEYILLSLTVVLNIGFAFAVHWQYAVRRAYDQTKKPPS